MFRAQLFEGIFTLIPVLLIAVVSILLRARAAKRRKGNDETSSPSRVAAPTRAQPERKRETTTAFPEKPGAPAPSIPKQPVRPAGAYGAGYTYPPTLPLNNLKGTPAEAPLQPSPVPRAVVSPAPETRKPDLRERMESRSGPIAAVKEASIMQLSAAGRLERLPPLKRAVVWAEILAPPGGRQ